jgi:N-acetylglucosaminyl-diphospho-decaprenol L-rhamnosyltransferase
VASAYVVNLNGGEKLSNALTALSSQTAPVELVVIDNASSDGSLARIEKDFPHVRLVALPRNVGFGRAVNAGIMQFPGDPVVLVNNDAVCAPRFIEALLEQAAPSDMVAGVLVQSEEPGLIDSAGVVADTTLLAFDYLHGLPLADAEGAPPPLGPTGGAALLSLETFNQLGGFDERMFAYLEDVDLALRARRTGARCRLAWAARALHDHSSTLGAGSTVKNHLMGTSRGYMLRRYQVLYEPRRAARALAAEAAICGGQLLIDHTWSGVRGRVRGWASARALAPHPFPEDGLLEVSLRHALSIRFARSRTTRHSATTDPARRSKLLSGRSHR